MISLSYSSLNILHTCRHNWINKTMGIPQEEKPFFEKGKQLHRIIQDHVARIKVDKDLKHILIEFPIVEQVDFDPRCKFTFRWPYAGETYDFIGFIDGLDPENKRFLEIKSGVKMWSVGQFQKAIQRKIYALARPDFQEAYLITCLSDLTEWKTTPPKLFKVPLTDQDRKDATDWINAGIEILNSGDFMTDLVNGKCFDPYCYWGKNCQFK